MINKNIKLAIIVLLFVVAIWQFYEDYIGNGIFLIFLASIVTLFYFKNEVIIMTLLKLRKQDFDGAKQWLNKIKKPEDYLVQGQQGYFYFLSALTDIQTNLNEADRKFRKAVELGIKGDDLALAKLNMAGVAMSRRRKLEATNLLNEAKKLDTKNMLKEQISQMREHLKRI
ncbi:MAG: DUF2892 domain-containing protein [Bacteroidota bacterium]|nr:DUF2892 domain-containing protein [Bacteroidota bacterium]